MIRSASVSRLSSEFDQFLFMPIGEDANGTPLSVLSALARLSLDPWREAAELTRMPKETAVQRLSSLIAALPSGPSSDMDASTTAARLISFLPRGPQSDMQARAIAAATDFRAVWCMTIFMACMLVAGWLVAASQSPAPADTTLAPTSTIDSPKTALLDFSQ